MLKVDFSLWSDSKIQSKSGSCNFCMCGMETLFLCITVTAGFIYSIKFDSAGKQMGYKRPELFAGTDKLPLLFLL